MKRNTFLTYFFSFCPGAGQMYQGYMKRGLTLVLLFALTAIAAFVFMPPLLALSAVVYMYSFFDSLNLRADLLEGNPPEDRFPLHLDLEDGDLKKLLKGRHHLLGWGCVLLGILGVYRTMIEPLLYAMISLIPTDNQLVWELNRIVGNLPELAVGVLFVLVGVWLIRGDRTDRADFEAYKGEEPEAGEGGERNG